MRIKTKVQGEISENDYLSVYLGEDRYRITESIEGKLRINKISDVGNDFVKIHPISSNEIELS